MPPHPLTKHQRTKYKKNQNDTYQNYLHNYDHFFLKKKKKNHIQVKKNSILNVATIRNFM